MSNAIGPSSIGGNPTYGERFGTWFLAVVAVVILPLFPLFVEALKDKQLGLKTEDVLLTAAVMAIGFTLASEANVFRAAYVLLFLFSLIFDFRPENIEAPRPAAPLATADIPNSTYDLVVWLTGHPLFFLAVVCGLQCVERLDWHLSQKRKFPDWLN